MIGAVKAQHIVGGYLLLQAAGVAAWWVLLWGYPTSIAWFQPAGWSADTLRSFWLADGLMLVGGSLAVAVAVLRSAAWASTAVWALAAACAYPALYCIGASATTGEAWRAAALMTTMAGLTLAMATIYGHAQQPPATFRAVEMSTRRALVWTALQIVVFWATFFWVLPMAIVEAEAQLGIERFDHPMRRPAAALLFVAAGSLGLWSAMSMARRGRGTPLPTATGSALIIDGPYRWVRNPMALAGIVQGIAVGWWLGSFAVIAYAVAGGILWHVAVRPAEEADLTQRFGGPYRDYRIAVGLWVPKIKRDRRS